MLGVLVVMGLVLVAGPVQAADPSPPHDSSTGRTGVYRLPDSEVAPAGRCRYGYVVEGEGYYNGVHNIRVRRPGGIRPRREDLPAAGRAPRHPVLAE